MMTDQERISLARRIRDECIRAAREGFQEASISGLCRDGAIEAAISAMQSLNLEKLTGQSEG
jgi:hypothetical protein